MVRQRGDDRDQLVRLEDAMRNLRPYSDRYWKLKAQRNALRARRHQGSLSEMDLSVADYEPVFAKVPNDWRKRWRLLREFTEKWYGIPLPDVGGQTEQMVATERELGMALPPSVREWIAFCWNVRGDNFIRVMRDYPKVAEFDSSSAISLMYLAEGDYCWAVKKKHLRFNDPPVDVYCNFEKDAFEMEGRFARHVTSFVFRHMLVNLSGKGGTFDDHKPLDSPKELIRNLSKYCDTQAQFDEHLIFEKRNMIAVVGPATDFANRRTYLKIAFWKKGMLEQLPAFLKEHMKSWLDLVEKWALERARMAPEERQREQEQHRRGQEKIAEFKRRHFGKGPKLE